MELALRMSNPFRTREFSALFQEWNKRLKESGFVDAEDFTLPDPALKSWHSLKWESQDAQRRESQGRQYIELAQDLLHNGFPFKNDVHRRTWELHCEGKSARQIEEALFSQLIGYKGRKKTNVHSIIIHIQRTARLKLG